MDFEIEEESLNTPAIVLKMPNIIIRGENGPMKAQPVDDFKYFQTRGFLKDVKQLKTWGIVYEYPKYEKAYSSFFAAYEQYIKKRHFDRFRGPILTPTPRPLNSCTFNDILSLSIESIESSSSFLNRDDQLLVLILPDGIRGSELKAKFTKLIQSQNILIVIL